MHQMATINKLSKKCFIRGDTIKLNSYFFKLIFLFVFLNLFNFVSFGINYTFDDGTVTFSGNGTISREDVTNAANDDIETIEKVIIGADVTGIGDMAFYGCKSLTTVKFKKGFKLETIGKNAFSGCTSLANITIPASVTDINQQAFYDCKKLATAIFAEGSQLKTIGEDTFNGCTSLTEITIPANVTGIGDMAFYGCKSLTTVIFAEDSKLKTIGKDAFTDCKALTEITIPASVTDINQQAFYYCKALTTVIFAEDSKLETIGKDAFKECESLLKIAIPANVTKICDAAFAGCTNLTIEVEEGNLKYEVKNNILFSKDAEPRLIFYPISKTDETYTIPKNVTIGNAAFAGCTNLKNIELEGGNTKYKVKDGVLFSEDETSLICYPAGKKDTSYTIPKGVTIIGKAAFAACTNLKNIVLPLSITKIEDEAFYGCIELQYYYQGSKTDWKSVKKGNKNHDIDNNLSFNSNDLILKYDFETNTLTITGHKDCKSVDSDNLSDAISAIYPEEYDNIICNLTTVIINDGITSIGEGAFRGYDNLTNITMPAKVTKIEKEAFSGCIALTTVIFAEDSELESIGENAFSGCEKLTNITIPAKVTKIEKEAFKDCYYLESVNFKANSQLKTIGECAFRGCFGEEITIPGEIKIPKTVTEIEEEAFSGCIALTTVIFNEGSNLKTISTSAFRDCSSLTKIIIPKTVIAIGNAAFSGCTALTIEVEEGNTEYKVKDGVLFSENGALLIFYPARKEDSTYTIPENVKIICEAAFAINYDENTNLTKIITPKTVQSVQTDAFFNRQKLTVYYLGTQTDFELLKNNIANSGNGALHTATIHYSKMLTVEKVWITDTEKDKDNEYKTHKCKPNLTLYIARKKEDGSIEYNEQGNIECDQIDVEKYIQYSFQYYSDKDKTYKDVKFNDDGKVVDDGGKDEWFYNFLIYDYNENDTYIVKEDKINNYETQYQPYQPSSTGE